MSETFEIARKNMVVNQLRPNKINEENILQKILTSSHGTLTQRFPIGKK